MLTRDMGCHSDDGINWGQPDIGYKKAWAYFNEVPIGLDYEGHIGRPQLLMKVVKLKFVWRDGG